jgi:hypothetical protein
MQHSLMQETMSNNKPCEFPRKGDETMNDTRQTKMFIGALMLATASAAGYTGYLSHSLHPYFALAVLALAAVTSRMKVKLPGLNGNMSVNLPFLLTAIANLSAVEAVTIAFVSTAVQCWPRKPAKLHPQQLAFNLSMMSLATCLASLMYHAQWPFTSGWNSNPLSFALAAATLFLGQTLPVAAIISLGESKSVSLIWWNLAHMSFPYFVVSAGASSMVQTIGVHMGWDLALGVFPVMYGIHRSYSLYFTKMAESTPVRVMVRAAGAGA